MSNINTTSNVTSEEVLATYGYLSVVPSATGMIISFVTYILLWNENNKNLNLTYQILKVDSLMSMMGNIGGIILFLSGLLNTPNTFFCTLATALYMLSLYSLFVNNLVLACPR